MELPEKIYTLRRQKGMSQEQLAEALEVSRQAVSKWESGRSVPDPDKLVALSRFFSVSVDWLLRNDLEGTAAPPPPSKRGKPSSAGRILCLLGSLGLLLTGLVIVFLPSAAGRLEASSAVNLGGTGIVLLICVLALASGAFLCFRNR